MAKVANVTILSKKERVRQTQNNTLPACRKSFTQTHRNKLLCKHRFLFCINVKKNRLEYKESWKILEYLIYYIYYDYGFADRFLLN